MAGSSSRSRPLTMCHSPLASAPTASLRASLAYQAAAVYRPPKVPTVTSIYLGDFDPVRVLIDVGLEQTSSSEHAALPRPRRRLISSASGHFRADKSVGSSDQAHEDERPPLQGLWRY